MTSIQYFNSERYVVNNDVSVVYYTDNKLDKTIFSLCQKELLKVAGDIPIISVSQKPLDFGTNICMPGIGSSHLSMFKQMVAGLEAVKTKYVVFAEHDCLYTPEYFKLRPLKEEQVGYNDNVWFVDWKTGEYSYRRRKPFSQLISNTETILKALRERFVLLEETKIRSTWVLSEPGWKDYCTDFILRKKAWCEKKNIPFFRYRAEAVRTTLPNLDIRHTTNITRARGPRSRQNIYKLPYWGNFRDYINGHSLP